MSVANWTSKKECWRGYKLHLDVIAAEQMLKMLG